MEEQSNWMTTAREWLKDEDSKCHEDRAIRLAWMAERINTEEHQAFSGGLLGYSLYEEMRYSFVYGQFLAASALGFAYIEQTVAAYFYGIGSDKFVRTSVQELLAEALERGLINHHQWGELDRIRKTRNVYTHFRQPGHKDSVERRAIQDDDSFYGIIEQDAVAVVEAALWISAQISIL